MSQKLSRTINLPKAPASFTDEQRRYFDDIARSLTDQFRDIFDLLGEDSGSLEKHLGDTTAHKMSAGDIAGVGVIRGADGKVRFVSADGTEPADDYGVTYGYVSPMLAHVTELSAGVHGSTVTPTAGRIPLYGPDGRLKGSSPVDSNDLATKSFVDAAKAEAIAAAADGVGLVADAVFPSYATRTPFAKATDYTASSNGYIYARIKFDTEKYLNFQVIVNGAVVADRQRTGDSIADSALVPVKKGSTYRVNVAYGIIAAGTDLCFISV